MEKNEFREFKERLVVTKELFYNEGSMFGAYGFRFEGENNPLIKVHPQWNNFSIGGEVQQLTEGKAYTVVFKESFDERKQIDTYTFVRVESDGIQGREAHTEFIKEILTEKQANGILNEFPNNENIVYDILEDKVDLTQVKGIKNTNAMIIKEKLSKVPVYSEAITKLSPIGVGIKPIVKLVEHFGSPEKLIQVVDKDIYRLTEVNGFGFKRVDKYALELGFKKDDKRRIESGAIFVIEELSSSGDTKIGIDLFDEKLCDILEIESVDDELFSRILKNDKIFYDNGFITLKEFREEEMKIVEHLRRLRDNYNPVVDEEDIETVIKLNEDRMNIKFNEKQKEAITKASINGVFILDGRGGTGKSFSLKTAVEVIGDTHLAVALSGKASNVLSQNGLEAATIHRALIFNPVKGGFKHNEHNPIHFVHTFILDEASMVDNRLLLQLLQAIPNGSQLLIVGDSGQLPAIGRGATFDYLLNTTEFEHVTLTEVHRQAQDSGTLKVANMVRDGKQFNSFTFEGTEVYGNNKDFYSFGYTDKSLIVNDLLSVVERYVNNPDKDKDDLQIITGLKEKGNTSVVNLNKMLQPIFNPENEVMDTIKGKTYEFRLGDRVIQQGNKYKALTMHLDDFNNYANGFLTLNEIELGETQVFNGTFGKIIACAEGYGILVEFEDVKGTVFFEKSDQNDEIGVLDLGYAISCHRSQGSGFKTLFMVLSFSDFMLLSRQFLYTGLTRTINQCFLFAETKAVHYAIKTDKGKSRKCYIGEFLK